MEEGSSEGQTHLRVYRGRVGVAKVRYEPSPLLSLQERHLSPAADGSVSRLTLVHLRRPAPSLEAKP